MAKMPAPWPVTPLLRVLAAPLIAMGALAGLGYSSASAAGCQGWTAGQPPSPGSADNRLNGVVVLSACDAWAVGSEIGSGPIQALIEHWDGSSWAVVPSPSPGTAINGLNSVRAASAASIWAVGKFRSGGADQTLILHWNGTTWQRVPSPSPSDSELRGVRAVSAGDAWAVGYTDNGGGSSTLVLRWNGTKWTHPASPNGPGTDSFLSDVVATSAGNALAVGGFTSGGSGQQTLVLRWNGSAWQRVASPNPGPSGNALFGVAASSARNAWAVGNFRTGLLALALAVHCC